MAKLIVHRRGQYNGSLRALGVYVDDQKIGEVGNGKTEEFEIAEGSHVLELKMDFKGERAQIVAREGTPTEVDVDLCSAWLNTLGILGIIKFIRIKAR